MQVVVRWLGSNRLSRPGFQEVQDSVLEEAGGGSPRAPAEG